MDKVWMDQSTFSMSTQTSSVPQNVTQPLKSEARRMPMFAGSVPYQPRPAVPPYPGGGLDPRLSYPNKQTDYMDKPFNVVANPPYTPRLHDKPGISSHPFAVAKPDNSEFKPHTKKKKPKPPKPPSDFEAGQKKKKKAAMKVKKEPKATFRSGSTLGHRERIIISNVHKYFQMEREKGVSPFRIDALVARTACATGVSHATVKRIVKDGADNFTPESLRKRGRKKQKLEPDESSELSEPPLTSDGPLLTDLNPAMPLPVVVTQESMSMTSLANIDSRQHEFYPPQ